MTTRFKKHFLFFGILTAVICACLGLETKHSNHLGWALLFIGTAFTMIACIYLGSLFNSSEEKWQSQDHSLWLPCIGTLMIGLVTPLEYLYLPETLPRNDYFQDVGLILIAGGLAFYLLSLRSRQPWKTQFNQSRFIGTQSVLIICRLVLSPASASLLLFVIGLGIGYSSLIGLSVMFLLVLPGLIYGTKMINA